MSIQTTTYKKRLREQSDLSPMALHIAATIADLRYEKRLREHEPLPLTMPELAKACHMGSKNTARHYLMDCIAAGWVIARKVYRDGRQRPHEYFICDPTASDTEVRRVVSVIASGGQILRSDARPEWVMRLDTVLRSKNNGAGDDAAHRGGVGSDEQGPIKTASPVPPRQAGPDDAEPKPETRSWEETEAQLLDDMQAERRDDRFGELASMWADKLTGKAAEQRRRERERDMIHRRRRFTTATNQRFEESA